MKKRRKYLPVLIVGAWGLLGLTACSADEEALFVESTETAFYEEYEEGSSVESGEDSAGDSMEPLSETVLFEENEYLAVHVCGAVSLPGVYELEEGSRVMDAVLAAGGFSDEADEEYVNLATVLADGDKVRIPTKNEVAELSVDGLQENDNGVISAERLNNSEQEAQNKVNINTADEAELCSLPGIGQTRAESIIAYRNARGAFAEIEDIMQVSGIKESSFQKIKDKITVK